MANTDMQYTRLGSTGLEVSRLCLGSMNFGTEAEWMMNDREDSVDLIQRALDHGINFIDTANTYSNGESESIVGDAIEGYDREQLVLATKVNFPATSDPGPNQRGLSRKHIFEQVEDSLDRLGTDYIDLYQIHRWDEHTPIEETLSALDALVQAGKVRYIGASSMAAWQFMNALRVSDLANVARFACLQPEYSLIRRHEEENLLPVAADQGIGCIPWSPLAGGFLTGKYTREHAPAASRLADAESPPGERYTDEEWQVLDRVREIADSKAVTPAQISLAWLLHKDVVDAPIIGPRTPEHFDDSVDALDVSLSDDAVESLEEPISPSWSHDLSSE